VLFAETVKTEVSCGKMLSLKEMACASIKTRLREQFMQMVMHRLDPTARSKNLPRCLDSPETAEFDFDDIFCQVLHNNGAKTQDVVTDSFDFLVWDDADEDKSDYFKFISSILNVHRQHHIAYMSFLSSVRMFTSQCGNSFMPCVGCFSTPRLPITRTFVCPTIAWPIATASGF